MIYRNSALFNVTKCKVIYFGHYVLLFLLFVNEVVRVRTLGTSVDGHFAYGTLRLLVISPTRHFAYWTVRLHVLDSSPTRHFA